MSKIINATYSAEDNKLRFYVDNDGRLSPELYARARELGFVPAKIQKLFVAPRWTVEREDFCLEFVDEIFAEESTVAERAAAKATRLEALSDKRIAESDSFQNAAIALQHRIAQQPVLLGHHSSRKIEKEHQKLEKSQEKSVEKLGAANYWLQRATNVERHANRKNDCNVRTGRIKTLLKELRDVQKSINHAALSLKLWTSIKEITCSVEQERKFLYYLDAHLITGSASCSYSKVNKPFRNGDINQEQAIDKAIDGALRVVHSQKNARIISHVLNRLSYERSYFIGNMYEGKLSDTIIQAFARQNGAFKPKCKKVEGKWQLTSLVPLPLHLNCDFDLSLTLTDSQWIQLMYDCGYTVPQPKPKSAPILNFKAKSIKVSLHGNFQDLVQITLTKAEYKDVFSDYRGVKSSECGNFRVRICKNPNDRNEWYMKSWVSVFISDSKEHNVPDSNSVVLNLDKDVA